MNIREKAREAFENWHTDHRAWELGHLREEAKALCVALYDRLGLEVQVDELELGAWGAPVSITLDGVEFQLGYGAVLCVVFRCHECRQEVCTEGVQDWSSLGAALNKHEGQIWPCLTCRTAQQPPPSTAEQLGDLIREIAAEGREG